jgi:WhiB family redox-sensing transcriptional regulator
MTGKDAELFELIKTLDMSWAQEAACRHADANAWFSHHLEPAYEVAKTICRTCPVINQCLEHALTYEHDGIWGGLGSDERKQLKRNMRRGPIT